MNAVEIPPALIRVLQARARKERITVDRLVKRLIADALQELDDYEAVKAFRVRPGRTAPLEEVKKCANLERRANRHRSTIYSRS